MEREATLNFQEDHKHSLDINMLLLSPNWSFKEIDGTIKSLGSSL